MDWELYQRQRATLVFIGVAFFCFLLLAFQRSSPVQHLKAFLVACTFPTQRMFSRWVTGPSPEKLPEPPSRPEETVSVPAGLVDPPAEQSRALRVLAEENTRLGDLLELKREHWPRMVAAHVVGRNPQRWFQEILLDKGMEEGVRIDDPVVALAGKRQALIGRIVETGAHTSRVMLIYDPLSAVAATAVGAGKGEDGVVEGTNGHDLLLNYLSRNSQAKIGDLIVTSGLGLTFPEGIPIGWISDLRLDDRQLFLQAKLSSALLPHPLRLVAILVKAERP